MSDPLYTEIIIDEARNPQNQGNIPDADVSHHDSNPMCGDSITLQLKFKDNFLDDVKWDGKGCTICTACTSVLTQLIKGKDIDSLKKMEKEEVLSELGLEHLVQQSPVRIKCALLSMKVLKLGLYSYLAEKGEKEKVDNLKEEAKNLY